MTTVEDKTLESFVEVSASAADTGEQPMQTETPSTLDTLTKLKNSVRAQASATGALGKSLLEPRDEDDSLRHALAEAMSSNAAARDDMLITLQLRKLLLVGYGRR